MSTDLIQRLENFDLYVEELKAHNWHFLEQAPSTPKKWSADQAMAKRLQETMKIQHHNGNPYPMRAYWAFNDWVYQHEDIELRDQAVQSIRNELAIEATTQLITPENTHDP